MKWIVVFLLLVVTFPQLAAQTVVGTFDQLAGQAIELRGFNGFETYRIARATCDQQGRVSLDYASSDQGVGYLTTANSKPFIVILSGEDIEFVGASLGLPETIRVVKGEENQFFEQYAREQPRREQALSAWAYLERMYAGDPLFSAHQTPQNAIWQEKERIHREDADFLDILPAGSYIKWFLPTRKLVSSVSTISQYRPEEIEATIAAFRALDYADPRLYRSGLLRDAIEGHFWLIENSGNPLDTAMVMMAESIDLMVDHLLGHDALLNELTSYLFDLLERHSLFGASEHLALRLLNENGCALEDDLSRQLEIYRAMRKGNTAADIDFQDGLLLGGFDQSGLPKKLSDIDSKYTLVVFAAGWCETCRKELPELIGHYPKWRAAGVEVVLISLDDRETDFKQFVGSAPFLSFCDYGQWTSKAAHDYYVFGTPTFFLLDADRQIVLRPNSVQHADAWVEWNLLSGR